MKILYLTGKLPVNVCSRCLLLQFTAIKAVLFIYIVNNFLWILISSFFYLPGKTCEHIFVRTSLFTLLTCNDLFTFLACEWFSKNLSLRFNAPCGLQGCKNGPAPFPGLMSYKATKPGLDFVLYLSMFFVLMFIRAPFYVSLVFIICVVCLLVVLVKLSLLAKLLARKTPLSSELSPLQFLALA